MPEIDVEQDSITIDIEVYCDKCGNGLCGQTRHVTTRKRNAHAFRVMPCEKCIEDAKEDGRNGG